jgi:integrase
MARERSGLIVARGGKIYARVTYVGKDGKRHEKWRVAKNRTHARELKKQLLQELAGYGEEIFAGDHLTFRELATFYQDRYLKPAEYREGRKVMGLRSVSDGELHLKTLTAYFGHRKIRSLTYGDIEAFKHQRLNTPTVRGQQRSLANVHRTLALLRHLFNIAVREGWLMRSPFVAGKPLINLADEKKRERVLTIEEEVRLLAACDGPRAHLKPILICALDTGMRQGEIFKLKWSDVDLETRRLTVQAMNSKTLRERQVPLTARLACELEALRRVAPLAPETRVFGIQTNVVHSFSAVRRIARLADFRFHDLRHTAATRLAQQGLALTEIARILGHTSITTTFRYTNNDDTTLDRAAALLDAFQQESLTRLERSTGAVN